MHSGLQFGGDPLNSGKQEQDGKSPTALHIEFGPQGFGEQGSDGRITGSSIIRRHLVKGSPVVFGGQLQIGL